MQQLTGNPFYDVTSLRVPFLHMMREEESRPNEQLDRFELLGSRRRGKPSEPTAPPVPRPPQGGSKLLHSKGLPTGAAVC